MHMHTLEEWQHSHDYSVDQDRGEKNTKIVLLLTAVTMIAEVVAGTLFGSMALLADGWHMATHVAAFGITVFAYQFARTHAKNPKYTFGTGKVSVLGGFTSAIALAVIALLMGLESTARLFQPHNIQFNEAIYIAVIGLIVNLVSALLLQDHHEHAHHKEAHHEHVHHEHTHHEHHSSPQDHNLRAAYIHVLADALTSVLAIIALFGGKFLGWIWLDALMGFVGAAVILRWAYGLVVETSSILLDGAIDKSTKLAIVNAIEENSDNRVTDLHVWNISQHHTAATIALVTHDLKPPSYYKELLHAIPKLSHVLVEVNPCGEKSCFVSAAHLLGEPVSGLDHAEH